MSFNDIIDNYRAEQAKYLKDKVINVKCDTCKKEEKCKGNAVSDIMYREQCTLTNYGLYEKGTVI